MDDGGLMGAKEEDAFYTFAYGARIVGQKRGTDRVFTYRVWLVTNCDGYSALGGAFDAEGDLHGISHTLPGALVLGLLAALTGKYLSEWGLIVIKWRRYLPIRWKTAFISAYFGTFSHVFFDSIMHVDVSPFAPFSAVNPLHGWWSISTLHWVCVITGAVGAVMCVGREWWAQRKHSSAS